MVWHFLSGNKANKRWILDDVEDDVEIIFSNKAYLNDQTILAVNSYY